MNRTARIFAITAATLLLSASPAAAMGTPEPVPSLPPGLVTTEGPDEPEPLPCVGGPFEIAPGEWDCIIEPIPAIDEPVEEQPAPDVEPTDEPDPEPVVEIVEDNGGWGWSDAREAYRG